MHVIVFQVIGDVYNIGETRKLGMGVATKMVQGSFVGVFAAEFVLDSVCVPLPKFSSSS